ncbi:hypothetical protein AGMMS49975_09360 [Clostridia bacterium]|nr:hypothetical protein AGMMS49975_09360 [Clostridia bacterium]
MNEFETTEELTAIELSLPANAAYVSAVRQTASSIASRLNFDVDELEDVRSLVSEVCGLLIKKSGGHGGFLIKFDPSDGKKIKISFTLSHAEKVDIEKDDMGLAMIQALADKFDIVPAKNGNLLLSIEKVHKELLL